MPDGRVFFDGEVSPVDLAAPSRIVRGRLPAIEAIQDRLSRQLRLDLFQYLRYGVQVQHAQTNFEPHDEVMRQFSAPVLIGILSIAPLRGFSVVAIDGALVGAAVDRLCGASEPSTVYGERDDFSIFEMRIAKRLLGVIQESMKYAWQGVADLDVELVRTEVNTSFIAIADGQEPLITMRMRVVMATGEGEVVIAIPYPSIEPIRDKLSTAAALTELRDEDKRYWQVQMGEALARVSTPIRAELTRVTLPLTTVETLRPGQVIPIRIPPTARVYSADTALFDADFGSREGSVAVRVAHFLEGNSPPLRSESDDERGRTEPGQSEDGQ
ncbi:MAG TPA: FliM/FliN family flagellar motor switch protein [Gammaproteobacteria bacterium]|nr:FliM/FliN family flagellar motor switch protein [Gammaproteobacteria bacterium]